MEKHYYSAENYNERLYTGLRSKIFSKSHTLMENYEFKKIDKVLEIGGGSTPHIKYIQHKFSEYYSLDLDSGQKLSEYMRQNFKDINFSYYDGKNIPFNNETFDRVIISHCLEHILEPEKFTEEMVRVMKKGGVLSIALPCDPGLLWRLGRYYIKFISNIKKKIFSIDSIEISDYENAIEHINSIFNLYIILREKFKIKKETFYPFNIKLIDINLIYICQIEKE